MNNQIRTLLSAFALLLFASAASSQAQQDWRTFYEKSGYLQTPRYAQTIEYCKRLAKASPWVEYTTFGKSPQGRDLPLVILSKDRIFDPVKARAAGKAVLLIQSCIHPGESDGKDASLMLIRDFAISKKSTGLLDHVVVLFVPIFNVDGHERFGPYNRINQNGPEEMGWRVTAQNLNLNRDYLKADTPEMRAMLKLFTHWLPEFYVDCHVTDGIDFQYDVTYGMEIFQNMDDEVSAWITGTYLPTMMSDVTRAGHLIAPYIWPREDRDITRGFITGPSTPRFSTGYAALQNRPALLIETHMLKPYKMRVSATYEILKSTIGIVDHDAGELRKLVRGADERTVALATAEPAAYLPIKMRATNESHPWEFKGIASREEPSDISDSQWTIYTGQPITITVPHYDQIKVVDSVRAPAYYLIPQEWQAVIGVLKDHGVQMQQLRKDATFEVEETRFSNPVWQSRPYEGRHPVQFQSKDETERRTFPAGTVVVPVAQRTGKIIVNLLEPDAPDSFVGWGFFDATFEQKEYGEPYVLEKLAREMIKKNPDLEREFRQKLASDSVFASRPYARLSFFFERSPYWDATIGLYPVARVFGKIDAVLLGPGNANP